MNKFVSALTLLLFFTLPSAAQKESSDEQTLKKADVPKAVLAAFEQAYPKAKVKGYSKESEEGKVSYEIESKEGNMTRDVSYDPEGNVLSLEESVPFSGLPQAVQDAVHKQFPKSKNMKCEKIVAGSATHYEIVLRSGKKSREVEFDPDGNVIKKESAKPGEKD